MGSMSRRTRFILIFIGLADTGIIEKVSSTNPDDRRMVLSQLGKDSNIFQELTPVQSISYQLLGEQRIRKILQEEKAQGITKMVKK